MKFLLLVILAAGVMFPQQHSIEPNTFKLVYDISKNITVESPIIEFTNTSQELEYWEIVQSFPVMTDKNFDYASTADVFDITPKSTGSLTPGSSQQFKLFINNKKLPIGSYIIPLTINVRNSFNGKFISSSVYVYMDVIDSTIISPSNKKVIPHIASVGGWLTEIILMNNTNDTSDVQVVSYDKSGKLRNTNSLTIGSNQVYRYYVIDENIASVSFNETVGGEVDVLAKYIQNNKTVYTSAKLVKDKKEYSSYIDSREVGIAVTNHINKPQVVTISMKDIGEYKLTLGPYAQESFMLYQVLPVSKNVNGILNISAPTEGISVFEVLVNGSHYSEIDTF